MEAGKHKCAQGPLGAWESLGAQEPLVCSGAQGTMGIRGCLGAQEALETPGFPGNLGTTGGHGIPEGLWGLWESLGPRDPWGAQRSPRDPKVPYWPGDSCGPGYPWRPGDHGGLEIPWGSRISGA
jgi:hypothetical protein